MNFNENTCNYYTLYNKRDELAETFKTGEENGRRRWHTHIIMRFLILECRYKII